MNLDLEMIEIKSEKEIELIKRASVIVAKTLKVLKESIRPGISTYELDEIAFKTIKSENAKPAFLGYRGYPATTCISVNEEVIHGIPDRKKILKEGDIVSIDVGAIYEGFYGDAAITVPVGNIKKEHQKLIDVTRKALEIALSVVRNGVFLGDVSFAIQEFVESNGMNVVRDFTGHGIGRNLHEEPSIPNFGKKGTGPMLRTGMTLAIEPMVCLGESKVRFLKDGWTVVTEDGSYSAHFEHTICVTDSGCEILSVI